MVSIENLKKHLRIDGDAEDEYLQILISAATAYVTGRTGIDNTDMHSDSRYDLACYLLIANWYANRETTGASLSKVPHGFEMILFSITPGQKHV